MPPENALTDIRAEWIVESTEGSPPSDPSWNKIGDYFVSYPGWSPDAGVEGQMTVGSGDFFDHFRGPENHDLELEYWLQRFWVDNGGNIQDPGAVPMTHDYQTDYPSHTVVIRRDTDEGGNIGGGIHEFVVGLGCKPVSVDLPGDPAEASPLAQTLGYSCEKVRQYVIHQPDDTSVTVTVSSTSSQDTMDLVVENSDASSTDTITLTGTDDAVGSTSFDEIDSAWLTAEPEGDVTLEDGSGNVILELTGKNTNNVEGDRGVPNLGAGSHASDIGTDPENYLFLGTESTYGGGNVALSRSTDDRVHALDLSVEVDTSEENRQGTGRPVIDIGPRTVTVDADVAGPYESAEQNRQFFANNSADIVYTLPDGTVTVNNATRVDTDDVDREAGDANEIYGVTFEGHGDPAITLAHS